MMHILFSAVPIAVVWCAITGRLSLDSFALGYGIGLFVLLLLRGIGINFETTKSLDRPFALLLYALTILWTGLISSLHVVKLVLSPKIELKTGIVKLNTGDLSESQVLTALSAHGINMTPGELVIDIADGGDLYIHCLELAASAPVIEQQQAQRLRLLKRIVGEQTDE